MEKELGAGWKNWEWRIVGGKRVGRKQAQVSGDARDDVLQAFLALCRRWICNRSWEAPGTGSPGTGSDARQTTRRSGMRIGKGLLSADLPFS